MTNCLHADDYHAHPAMSKSKLDLFARDENLLAWAERCPVDTTKTAAFDFGDAMHAICLEPHRLRDEFAVLPELNLRTNAGKEERDEFLAANADKKILNADDHRKLCLMFESVMAHPASRALVDAAGLVESSHFWTDRASGIPCRCRPDKLILGGAIAVDIKTTPELGKFKYAVEDYRYHVQAPFYLDGLAENDLPYDEMRFLVIQKNIEGGRYPVMVVTLPPEVVEYGRRIYRQNLMDYAEFLQRAPRDSQVLELHHWFQAEAEDDEVRGIR